MKKFLPFFLISIVFLIPWKVSATTGMLDPDSTISQLRLLIAQYDTRIKQLENENAILKYEMVKAGIKIPLTDYSGAIKEPLPTQVTTNNTPAPTLPSTPSVSTGEIANTYGKQVAGFVARITTDWRAIREHYQLDSTARIAGYEFVQTGANDHVFVDIVIGTGTTGVYDMKILYQFEKTEFKRKLIGMFVYDIAHEKYITKSGANPFAGTNRVFVKDPNYSGVAIIPSTANPTNTSSPGTSPSTSASTPSNTSVSIADITKAYSEKKYLTTISLSSGYLASNPPTFEILNIRYRTYFIIGKYTESLAEVAKMDTLGMLDRQTACNAQVIATYSNNQTLVTKYGTLCKK